MDILFTGGFKHKQVTSSFWCFIVVARNVLVEKCDLFFLVRWFKVFLTTEIPYLLRITSKQRWLCHIAGQEVRFQFKRHFNGISPLKKEDSEVVGPLVDYKPLHSSIKEAHSRPIGKR